MLFTIIIYHHQKKRRKNDDCNWCQIMRYNNNKYAEMRRSSTMKKTHTTI